MAVRMHCQAACVHAGPSNHDQASHEDAKAVHSLLSDTLQDEEAAAAWFSRCQEVFCWSQYFAGPKRLQVQAVPDSNGSASVESHVENLSLNGHK